MKTTSIAFLSALFLSVCMFEASAALPVAGVAHHFDASAASTLTTVEENGVRYVTRWNDASGGSVYASATDSSRRPHLGSFNGKTVVDFGTFRYGSGGSGNDGWLKWSARDTAIREVFMVYSDVRESEPVRPFLLGDGTSYDFHRNDNGALFNAQYASSYIKNGVIEVDGESVSSGYVLPAGFHIIHLRTTGKVNADQFARDRGGQYANGGQMLGEVIIYDSTLSNEDAATLYGYLRSKWFSIFTITGEDVVGVECKLGNPSPAYDATDIGMDESVSLSMPSRTAVAQNGDAYSLAGWKIETVGEDGERTLVRSSAQSGESIDSCTYTPTSTAVFTWLWALDDLRIVAEPSLVSATPGSLNVSVGIEGLGGAASATVRFVYGPLADAMTFTNTVAPPVTAPGPVVATIPRLQPGTPYYVKAVVEAGGETIETDTLCFRTEDSADVVGQPGLWQTFFTSANSDWTKDIWAVPEGEDWQNYTDANRIRRRELTPIGAYLGGNPGAKKYTSEVWGDQVWWPVNGGQWVYAGYIFLDSLKSYKFRMKIDDNERIQITDAATGITTTLVNDTSNGSGVNTSPAYSPSATGWHAIEIRMSDGTGGVGGYDSGNNYINSNNLGFSQDGGSTWDILKDPGDGSLLRTGAGSLSATANVSGGALASVTVTFLADSAARDLKVAIGPVHGGSDPSDWAATATVATVAAGAESYTWTPPADWGSDQKLVARFYFDGAGVEWSNAIYWQDYTAPIVEDIVLDGVGGDTLVVSGNLASFQGADCVLMVLTGDSPTTLTNVWTGLAGATRTAAGDFTLTLFEGDTSSARYLTLGEVYYVSVAAVSDGKVSVTAPVAVKMASAPAFNSTSTSIARRTVTVTGNLSSPGMAGSATVTLYVGASSDGENALVAAEAPVVVTDNSNFSFTHVFPAVETTYKWQLRAVSTSAGATATRETRTAVATVTTKDTTTYTWTGAGSDNRWSNRDNWSDNQGGDCFGYPDSADATARFRTSATVDIDVKKTIASLDLAVSDCEITFTSASTTSCQLTLNGITMPLEGTTWTIEGAYVYRAGDVTPQAESRVVMRNGGKLYLNTLHLTNPGSVFEIGDGGTNDIHRLNIGSGAMIVSNGFVNVREIVNLGQSTKGGSLVFKGTHPRLHSDNNGSTFSTDLTSPEATLGFEVPEGGYDSAVITCNSGKSQSFFSNAKSQGVTIKVMESSGAFNGAAATTSPLVKWYKGYSEANMTFATIPSAGSAFAIENTTDLNVTIYPFTPVSGRLSVVSDRGTPSPAVGGHDGYVESTEYSLSSGGPVVSGGVRDVCVGYRLYSVDSLTGERTFLSSGADDPLSLTFPGGWVEVEWLWEKENATAAGASANGTVQLSGEWAGEYGYVTATAVPDSGYRFSYWSGDITDVQILQNPAKVPGNRPRTLVANFVPADTEVVNNTYTGASGGSWNTDSNWSLGHAPTAEENAIIPSGKGTVKITNAGVCASLSLIDNTSLQLQGSGTVADDQIRLDVRGNAISTGVDFTLGTGNTTIYNVMLNVGGDLCISNNQRNSSFTVYPGDSYGSNTDAVIKEGYTGTSRLAEYFRGGAQINVGGAFILGGTHASNKSTLKLYSHAKTGMSPVFQVGRFVVEKCGVVTGDTFWGWRSNNNGYHGIGSARKDGGGASYGGVGGVATFGNSHASGLPYGYEAAPFWPGSAAGRGGNDGGHGGSLFRLHAAGDVVLDGTINMNGSGWSSNNTRGGGSGGGVWITCDTFSAGANASVTAKGGGHNVSSAAAGGGGRVAVAAGGVSDADIASFFTTGFCDGYVMNDFSESLWPTLVNVAGGVNTAAGTHYDWNDGTAGTAKFLQNANGKSVLTITGSPLEVGEASPECVTHIVDAGDILCSNGEYGYEPGTANGTRWALDGYVWTNAATSGSGSSTSVTVPAQGDTTLVWVWRDREHNLVATSGGYGTVSAHNDWIADGASVTLTATPDSGAVFVRWTGDIETSLATSATITFTMTAPRRLIAVFDKSGTAPRNLVYSGGDWFDPATWDGVAIPGTNDVVTLSSGTLSIPFGATIDVGDLVVSGGTLTLTPTQGAYNPEYPSEYGTPLTLHVAGDFTLSGSATLNLGVQNGDVRTDVVVGGTLSVGGSTTMHVYSSVGEADDALRTWRHYKAGGAAFDVAGDIVVTNTVRIYCHSHGQSGVGVVWHAGGNVVIGESAQLNGSTWSAENNSYGYGWRYPYAYAYPASGAGSHGGAGGGKDASTTYGYAYAPFYPGSPGNGNKGANKGEGGGTVRIDAGGNITLLGKIYVTGGVNDGYGNNAAAGGSVWLTCDSFTAGASALINARGGRSNQHGACSGGGGGRVAVITGSPSEEQIDSLYATGVAEDLLVVAEDMNDELVSPWPSLVDVRGGICGDQASNAAYGGHGKPGTAVYLQNAAGKAVITVTGNQDTTETVPAYG